MAFTRGFAIAIIASLSVALAKEKETAKPKKQVKRPDMVLTSLCEEGTDQFRWEIENTTNKVAHFVLFANDRAGVRLHGKIEAQSSIFAITYRKVKENRGADVWTLKGENFSQTVERNRDSCRFQNNPPPTSCPPVPPPTVCPPIPDPVVCPAPVTCPAPTTCPPPPEPTVCPEPTICPPAPEPNPSTEAALPHPCLAANDPLQNVEPLQAFVRIRSDLTDTVKSFNYFEDITFTLQTCETMSVAGRFSTNAVKNQFSLDSQLLLGAGAELGATQISLMTSDGNVMVQSACDENGCVLNPFLIRDLQGNFGLASQTRFYRVVDYNIDGALIQKAAVFNTY